MTGTGYKVKVMRNKGEGFFGIIWKVVSEAQVNDYDQAYAYANKMTEKFVNDKVVITDTYNRLITVVKE